MALRHPAAPPTGRTSVVRLPRMHPHMLRHTYVTTMLDAGVDLRDVQIAARHVDPRTTMRYDRARTTSTATQLHPRRLHGQWHITHCHAELSMFAAVVLEHARTSRPPRRNAI